jgi:hypothetical protein
MRSLLERAFIELLNENTTAAEELFHKFIVERARQIHESNRSGEDYVLDENWSDEITTESYFTEEDLSDLEDDDADAGDEFADAESEFEDGDMEAGDEDMEAGEEDELDGLGDDEGFEDDDLEDDAGDPADRMEQAVDRMEELMAEFEAKMAELDGGLGDDEMADDDMEMADDDMEMADDDMEMADDDMEMADDVADDMEDSEEDDNFGSEDDEFDDISESIIDELEKVKVTMSDGTGVGTGSTDKPTHNGKSIGLQKNITARQGGSPNMSKQSIHKGFARETAPTVTPVKIKARNNNGPKLEKISKEGSAKAELNKPGTRAGEKVTGSVIDGKNGGKVK